MAPSSPPGPCSAIHTRSKLSLRSAWMGRSKGSKACASTPRFFSALRTASPLKSEISRSLESPPKSTAVLPKSLAEAARRMALSLSRLMPVLPGSRRFSDDAHFGVECNAALCGDGLLHVQNHCLDVGGTRRPMIDDEIGVLLRHRGIADAKSFQARGLDQPRGVIARRVGEHRPATPLADWLRLAPLVEEFLDGVGVDAGLALEFQARAHGTTRVVSLHHP